MRIAKPTIERWFEQVSINEKTQCWEWTGTKNKPGGYGYLHVAGTKHTVIGAHRLAYEHFIGPPGDLCVLHRCDNPSCSNPDHLFLGTHLDNALDRCRKGRGVTNRIVRKLSADKVRSILISRAAGTTIAAIAAKYGVSKPLIHMVVSGKRWAWLTEKIDQFPKPQKVK
jgi:HNH endonuclease